LIELACALGTTNNTFKNIKKIPVEKIPASHEILLFVLSYELLRRHLY